jgi:Family of unknown function (DUF5763)
MTRLEATLLELQSLQPGKFVLANVQELNAALECVRQLLTDNWLPVGLNKMQRGVWFMKKSMGGKQALLRAETISKRVGDAVRDLQLGLQVATSTAVTAALSRPIEDVSETAELLQRVQAYCHKNAITNVKLDELEQRLKEDNELLLQAVEEGNDKLLQQIVANGEHLTLLSEQATAEIIRCIKGGSDANLARIEQGFGDIQIGQGKNHADTMAGFHQARAERKRESEEMKAAQVALLNLSQDIAQRMDSMKRQMDAGHEIHAKEIEVFRLRAEKAEKERARMRRQLQDTERAGQAEAERRQQEAEANGARSQAIRDAFKAAQEQEHAKQSRARAVWIKAELERIRKEDEKLLQEMSAVQDRIKCNGVTKEGSPCKLSASPHHGNLYCRHHQSQASPAHSDKPTSQSKDRKALNSADEEHKECRDICLGFYQDGRACTAGAQDNGYCGRHKSQADGVCSATTLKGEPCKNKRRDGQPTCMKHA